MRSFSKQPAAELSDYSCICEQINLQCSLYAMHYPKTIINIMLRNWISALLNSTLKINGSFKNVIPNLCILAERKLIFISPIDIMSFQSNPILFVYLCKSFLSIKTKIKWSVSAWKYLPPACHYFFAAASI